MTTEKQQNGYLMF